MTGSLEVWQAPLDVSAAQMARLQESLSAPEREHAASLRGSLQRRRYIADHGWRRRLLGERLGCAPAEVRLGVSEHGKPEVIDSPLRFNASRSAGTAVYVASWISEVGVDVEEIRPEVDVAAMARRFFSDAERRALERLPSAQRAAAGFACWTRKEAYAKAVGTGLVFPLSALEVWAGDDRPVRFGDWSIHTLDTGAGTRGAVAVRGDSPDAASVPSRARIVGPG